jgi:tetratricopeptide (TPR) repeat protein
VGPLNNLAILRHVNQQYEEAERLYKRALAICETILVAEHPTRERTLKNYAAFLQNMGQKERARIIGSRVQAIQKNKTAE